MRIITLSSVILVILTFSVITNIYAQESSNTSIAKTLYFQLEIPDNWTYEVTSQSYLAELLGFGTKNTIRAMPSEYWDSNTTYAMALFMQDSYYAVKNAPLDTFAKYWIDKQNGMKVISQKDVILANETARQINAEGIKESEGVTFLQYYLFHNKEPYLIAYTASKNLYDEYLPEFEKMLKSLKWIE